MARKLLSLLLSLAILTCFVGLTVAEGMPDYLSKIIPVGTPNTIAGEHFTGKSFLYPLSTEQVGIFNVTFEPGSYNEWHIHHAEKGGGQILIAISGLGYYQEEGKPARKLHPGDVVNIPANVKHWHGAAKDSWFQHIAVEVPGEGTRTTWHGFLPSDEYERLNHAAAPLVIREQGVFSAGGTVTEPLSDEFNVVQRIGLTSHAQATQLTLTTLMFSIRYLTAKTPPR